MNRKLEIFTDGGCRHNPGIGAWAFIVAEDDEVVYQLSGSQGITTNNEMELMAIYEAEMWLHENADDTDDVIIYSDSQYSVNTINIWFDCRVAKGKVDGLKNLELIKAIMAIYDYHNRRYDIRWVRGHDGNKYNEQADKIVNRAMDALCCEM